MRPVVVQGRTAASYPFVMCEFGELRVDRPLRNGVPVGGVNDGAWANSEGKDSYLLRSSLAGAFSGTPDQLIDDLVKELRSSGRFNLNEVFGVIRSKNRSLELTEDRFWNMGYGSDHIHLLFNIWYREFEYTPAYENNLPQIDHIFPQSLLRQVKTVNSSTGRMNVMRYRDAERNQLANCMLLTMEENGAGGKADKPPEQWFVGRRAESAYLRLHLIPEDRSLWKIDRFEDFIAERKKLIAEGFKPLLEFQTQGTSSIVNTGKVISSKSVATLIDAGALEDGALLTLIYKGRKFTGMARPAGIELPDGVFSPSDAAIRCYAQIGSSRPTVNGWRVWRTTSGSTLNDLFAAVSGTAGMEEDVASKHNAPGTKANDATCFSLFVSRIARLARWSEGQRQF